MLNLKSFLKLLPIISYFLLLTGYIFRSLLLNISTHLLDWFDYPLMVWIINQNIEHITDIQINNFFNSNIFYPFQGTMLFSDLLLPSSILGFALQLFSSDPIVIFNIIFFITIFLNIWSSFLLWKVLFSDKLLIFFGTLITAFSPYFFMMLNHFQMINFWPFLFGLYFLFKEQFSRKNAVFVGLMISLEFLSSVYLCIFMLFAIGIWYAMKFIDRYLKKEGVKDIFIHGLIVLLTLGIIAGPFALKYIQVKKEYNITRTPDEYILYSAHITDYIFTTHYQSFISSTPLVNRWNSFNKHSIGEAGSFPGIVLIVLSFFGLLFLQRGKSNISIGIKLNFYNTYFLVLLVSGFIFSLGPRLNVNGVYVGIPLPYYAILEFFPLAEPIRANARWMWLLFLGLNYFALLGLKKFSNGNTKKFALTIILSTLFLLEIIPTNKMIMSKDFYPIVYGILEKECTSKPQVLLEYPMSRFIKHNNVIENLTYKTQFQLASVKHKCLLINGYSGYAPKDYDRFESQLFWAIENKDKNLFWNLMDERNVKFFKLNKDHLYGDRIMIIESWFTESQKASILLNDKGYLIGEMR